MFGAALRRAARRPHGGAGPGRGPGRYGGPQGPDLAEVAERTGTLRGRLPSPPRRARGPGRRVGRRVPDLGASRRGSPFPARPPRSGSWPGSVVIAGRQMMIRFADAGPAPASAVPTTGLDADVTPCTVRAGRNPRPASSPTGAEVVDLDRLRSRIVVWMGADLGIRAPARPNAWGGGGGTLLAGALADAAAPTSERSGTTGGHLPRVHRLPAGSRIRLTGSPRGLRAYLALAGGIVAGRVLGSAATSPPGALGGLDGRALRAGDVLMPVRRGDLGGAGRAWPTGVAPHPAAGTGPVRFVPGPDLRHLDGDVRGRVTSGTWTDRPGQRPDGHPPRRHGTPGGPGDRVPPRRSPVPIQLPPGQWSSSSRTGPPSVATPWRRRAARGDAASRPAAARGPTRCASARRSRRDHARARGGAGAASARVDAAACRRRLASSAGERGRLTAPERRGPPALARAARSVHRHDVGSDDAPERRRPAAGGGACKSPSSSRPSAALADGARFVDEARMEPLSLGVLAGLTPPGRGCPPLRRPHRRDRLRRAHRSRRDQRRDVHGAPRLRDRRRVPRPRRAGGDGRHARDAHPRRGGRARRLGLHRRRRDALGRRSSPTPTTGGCGRATTRVQASPQPGVAAAARPVRRQGLPADHPAPVRPRLPPPLRVLRRGRVLRPSPVHARPSTRSWPRSRRSRAGTCSSSTTTSSPTPRRPRSCCARSIPLEVRWVSQASVDQTRDPELMRLFVESGCLGNVIGFESLDPENLRQMRKGPNLPGVRPLRGRGGDAARPPPPDVGGVRARLRPRHGRLDPGDVRMGDREPLHLRRLQRAHALSVHAALRAAGGRGPPALRRALVAAPRLPLQLRGLPARAHDRRRAHRGGLGLPAALEQPRAPSSGGRSTPRTNMASPFRFALYCAYNPLFRREAFKKQGMRLGLR